ncbi:MAG: ABC transporter substrate-binding protein [Solimonas sp.]
MNRQRMFAPVAVALLLAVAGVGSWPAASRALDVLRARGEGRVVIYGTAEESKGEPLVAAFHKLHPQIDAQYQRRDSAGTYRQFTADIEAGKPVADIVWNSSMSAQVKLINDGYSRPYVVSAKDMLPSWATWKDEGYGITSEALVFAFNVHAPLAAEMPGSHRELLALLERKPELLRGRIGLIDPRLNEIAFMGYSQDLIASSDSARLYRAIAASGPQVFDNNRQLIDALQAGRIDLAFNLLGSYPLNEPSPDVRVVLPADYVLMTSRIAFISRQAPHPAAARLFLDFLLSHEAQRIIADEHLGAVRADVDDRTYAGTQARPIKVGPALLADFDQMRRRRLLSDWEQAAAEGLQGDKRPADSGVSRNGSGAEVNSGT